MGDLSYLCSKMVWIHRLLTYALISLVLCFSGTGITLTTCSHTHRVQMLDLSAPAAAKDACGSQKPCMTVTSLRLAPTVTASTQALQLPAVLLLPAFMLSCLPRPDFAICPPRESRSQQGIHMHPPRMRLNLLSILRI